ncbi:hypothetical protein FEP39_00659 [Burkholderia multivorans]|nr:hypothetical protein [Burkholderia multivorans]MDR9103733.1 hypothetical protein [Burkholderia multivorans]MDR9120978.1 hypothetical protein [Burkholderia multivorans]MDR9148799.1 hypothetical protein [Burkholderia multivorans]
MVFWWLIVGTLIFKQEIRFCCPVAKLGGKLIRPHGIKNCKLGND